MTNLIVDLTYCFQALTKKFNHFIGHNFYFYCILTLITCFLETITLVTFLLKPLLNKDFFHENTKLPLLLTKKYKIINAKGINIIVQCVIHPHQQKGPATRIDIYY